MRLVKYLDKILLVLGTTCVLFGVFSLPIMAFIMNLVVEDSGWPYWPPIYPGPRNFERVAGVFGLFVRVIYEFNSELIIVGVFLLVSSPIVSFLNRKLSSNYEES